MKNIWILFLFLGIRVSYAAIHPENYIDGSKLGIDAQKIEQPTSTLEPMVVVEDTTLTKPKAAEQYHFILKDISIIGNVSYANATLQALYQELLGTKISLAQLYDIADKITKYYVSAGYIFSQAFIPKQEIVNGKAKIEIWEAYTRKIEIKSALPLSNKMQQIIHIMENLYPLKIQDLEYYLLALNDLGGITAYSTLKARELHSDSRPGGIDLLLELNNMPNFGELTFNNHGSTYTSENMAAIEYSAYRALNRHGIFHIGYSNSPKIKNVNSLNVTYKIPVNIKGTELSATHNVNQARMQQNLLPLQVRTRFQESVIKINHVLLRSRAKTLKVGLGIGHKQNAMSALSQKIYANNLDKLSLFSAYDVSDNYGGANLFSLEFHQSLNWLTRKHERDTSSNQQIILHQGLNRWNAQLFRLQTVSESWSASFSVAGQYSHFTLPTSEKISYGGQVFGRAYDLAIIQGDSGVAGFIELNYKKMVNSHKVPLNLFTFIDGGRIWNHNKTDIVNNFGRSLGFGFRSQIAFVKYDFSFSRILKHMDNTLQKPYKFAFNISSAF